MSNSLIFSNFDISSSKLCKCLIYLFMVSNFTLLYSAESNKDEKKLDSLKKYISPAVSVSSTNAELRTNSVTFSNISRELLEATQTNQDIPMLLNQMPSIVSYSENGNGIGYSNISIRGFDQRRIAVLINGIPQNDPEDHNLYWINYSDISESMENIQIQRGAGLINYGAAAIAGSINLTGINFSKDKYIKLSTGGGFQEFGGIENNNFLSTNNSKFKFEYSSGLIDEKYAFYGKMSRINSWGYRDQSFSFMNTFYLSAIRYDENLSTQINVYGGNQNDGLAYYGTPKSFAKDINLRRQNFNYWEYDSTGQNFSFGSEMKRFEVEDFSSPHFEIINEYKISDDITVNSSLFYFTGKGYFDFSGAGWTDASTFRLNESNGFANAEDPRNPIIRSWVSNKQGGWIPKINIKHNDGILTIGAELRLHNSMSNGNLIYAENLPNNFDNNFNFYSYEGNREIFSIFAREIYNIDDNKNINIEAQLVRQGYRLGNEKDGINNTSYYDMNGNIKTGGDIFNIHYWFLNPRVGFNWNIDEQNNFYTNIAVTSREPRMQNLYQASQSYIGSTPQFASIQLDTNKVGYDFNSPLVKPETMLNVELGWNYVEQNFSFNSTVYLMEYFNELVKSGQIDIFGRPLDGNADRTRHIGLELASSYVLFNASNHKLQIDANTTLSQNYIINSDYFTETGDKISLDNNRIAGFSDLIANLSLNYKYENLNLILNGKYVGDLITDNFGDLLRTDDRIKTDLGSGYYFDNKLDAYFIMNLAINYKFNNVFDTKSINLQMNVNNLTNNLYAAMGNGRFFFAGAERNMYLGIELEL